MTKRSILTAVLSALFCLASAAVAHAQSCQNQSCSVNSSGCYICVNSTGSFCNLSGTCPQSCSEGSCTTTDPCASDPTAAGCPNPCFNDPNATVGCGTEIVCDGNTITSCSGGGGTGGGTGGGSGCGTQIICLARSQDRSLQKAIAALLPSKTAGSCQTASLPKNLLFSL